MKRFWILALALICACALGLSEEAFFAEESFGESGLADESLFSEEAFFSDDFFAEEPAEELAAPQADDAEAEARSVITLELELLNTEDEDLSDWQAAPILVAEPQKKEGAVNLTWVQSGVTALDKDIKYYVYAVDPTTGAGWQVGKPVAAKKNLSVKYYDEDGDEVTATGMGGVMKLTKQTTGTEYFVRAEKVAKADKKALGNAETYGKSSNHVTYTGDDGLWKTVSSLNAVDVGYGLVYLSWVSPMEPEIDEEASITNFTVQRTAWVSGKKQSPETVSEIAYDWSYEGSGFLYYVEDVLPDNTTKVQYAVTPVQDGVSGKTAKSKTLTIQQDAWKMVLITDLDQVDADLAVEAEFSLTGGIADTYVFKGFASNASVAMNDEGIFYPVLDKKGATPIQSMEYSVTWALADEESSEGYTAYSQEVKVYQDESGNWVSKLNDTSDATLEAMKSLPDALEAGGTFEVTGTVKDSLQATITVTPQKAKKNGVASKKTCQLSHYWKNTPEVYGRQVGENMALMQAYVADPQPGDQYIVKGFTGNVTATLVKDAKGNYDLEYEDPKGAMTWGAPQFYWSDGDYEGVLRFGGQVKGSSANLTVQVKRTVNGKAVSGKAGKVKVAIQAAAKSSAIVADLDEDDVILVAFNNINPNAETFRISVMDQKAHVDEDEEPFTFLAEFGPDDLTYDEDEEMWFYDGDDFDVIGYEENGGRRYEVLIDEAGTQYYVAVIETILTDGARIVDTTYGNSYVEY